MYWIGCLSDGISFILGTFWIVSPGGCCSAPAATYRRTTHVTWPDRAHWDQLKRPALISRSRRRSTNRLISFFEHHPFADEYSEVLLFPFSITSLLEYFDFFVDLAGVSCSNSNLFFLDLTFHTPTHWEKERSWFPKRKYLHYYEWDWDEVKIEASSQLLFW